MKVIVDNKIPYIREAIEQLADKKPSHRRSLKTQMP